MKKVSKRLKTLNLLIQKKKYSYEKAIELLKTLSNTKFIESIEAHFNLNLNPKYSNQQLKTNIILPHGTGKKIKIAVFSNLENIQKLYYNDSTIIFGIDNILDEISKNKISFDILITTPNLISQLTKFGKILGPKNLMPSLKLGTVTDNLIQSIDEFKKGKVEYKADKNGIVHINIGKINFTNQNIKENLLSIYLSIEKNKPLNLKNQFLKSLYICTTMSPSLNIDINSLKTYKFN